MSNMNELNSIVDAIDALLAKHGIVLSDEDREYFYDEEYEAEQEFRYKHGD